MKNVSEDAYESRWVMQNLERDAVHRRSIAQMQQERRAARAGILPTSSLYPVKRLAEAMDELLTLGEEARTQKRLDHADTRLDEAAALIQEGKVEEGKVPLADYHKSLVALASGSGDTIVQSLIQQSIARASSDMAAVLPDDSAYLIKEAVLEAGSSMPQVAITTADVQGMLLLDTISALLRKVDEGGIAEVGQTWADFQKYLAVLDDPQSDLTPEVRKEAKVLLSEFAFAVTQIAGQSSEIDPAFVKEVAAYLPPEMDAAVSVLSEEQVMSIVQAIRARIFTFDMARSRINQLNSEFKALEGHPDQGRILRRLYFELPEGPEHFPELVRKEVIRLQWSKGA
ncbi:hypothetical protein A3J91_03455 [Candidatus Peribacteria bacterium RIFOXYC2_FULL_58_10]|nr:MAG: hypothetical protein A3J91_03455 [Candidatus Peribacteria bacterium RIFOXYC2_FULL_58_10]